MIGIGIVGYGYWGPNLARCVAEAAGCRLVGIADTSRAALSRAAKRHANAALHEDWRELLADPAVDAIVVATPAATHFDIALGALRAGKHVLVEKPITTKSEDALFLRDVFLGGVGRGLVLLASLHQDGLEQPRRHLAVVA